MEPNDPTPKQIEQRAAKIRESWSEEEHFRRRYHNPKFRPSDRRLIAQAEAERRDRAG